MTKINMTNQYTSNGRPVRILCVDAKSGFPVVGLILYENQERMDVFTSNGQCFPNDTCEDDLKLVPKKRTGWVNIYSDENASAGFRINPWKTRHEADAEAGGYRIACIEISFIEGDGL